MKKIEPPTSFELSKTVENTTSLLPEGNIINTTSSLSSATENLKSELYHELETTDLEVTEKLFQLEFEQAYLCKDQDKEDKSEERP